MPRFPNSVTYTTTTSYIAPGLVRDPTLTESSYLVTSQLLERQPRIKYTRDVDLGMSWQRALAESDATTIADGWNFGTLVTEGCNFGVSMPAGAPTWNGPYYQTTTVGKNFVGFPMWTSAQVIPWPGDAGEGNDYLEAYTPVSDWRTWAREDYNAQLQKESQVEGLVLLGELSKTIRLLHNPCSALSKEAMRLGKTWKERGGKVKRRTLKSSAETVKRLTKVASETYLEWQFGVRPLLADIEGLVEAYSVISNPGRNEVISHLNRKKTFNLYKAVDTCSGGGELFDREVSIVADCQIAYSGGLRFENENTLTSMRSLGLLPKNIPAALIELTPFSFVGDYFINISNLFAAPGDVSSRVRYTSLVFRDEIKAVYKTNVRRSPGRSYSGMTESMVVIGGVQYKRDKDPLIGTMQFPILRIPRLPQVVNLAALTAALTL